MGDTLPEPAPPTLERLEERLEEIPGVVQAELQPRCCWQGKIMLYVGIGEEDAPRFAYHAPPDSAIALPRKITEAFREYMEFGSEAVRTQTRKPDKRDNSQGHSLSSHSDFRAIEEQFIVLAREHLDRLRRVLRHAADPGQRQTAAWVISYTPDKGAIVDDLVHAVRDPDYVVRNNATRLLGPIAEFALNNPELGIRIPAEPFVDMLNSIEFTDRNKASALLDKLTRSRDPAVLQQLRERALLSLAEMARWKSYGYAVPNIRILCRVGGYSEEEIAGVMIWDQKERRPKRSAEPIIARIVEQASGTGIDARDEIAVELPGGATMDFVWIEPGMFVMGSPLSESGRDDDEGPPHEVEITRGYYLGRNEISQGQWESVMESRPWEGKRYVQTGDPYPAVYIFWEDVRTFIERLNQTEGSAVYRLPTEAEWEYACRAGTVTRWSFGNDESRLGKYAWYAANAWGAGAQFAHATGAKRPNPWGLYDMHGNVWEWVQDWWDEEYYSRSSREDPSGPASSSRPLRVLRGGDFSYGARHTRSAHRGYEGYGVRRDYIGARLVRNRE